MRHLSASQAKGLFYQDTEEYMLISRIQQCVPDRHGCQRCSERKLGCPGLTKAKRTKSRSPVLIEPSPFSTATTSSVAGTPLEAPSSAPGDLPAPETAFNLQPGYQWSSIWGPVTPEWTQGFPSDRHGSPWMFIPEAIPGTSTREPSVRGPDSGGPDAWDELQGLEIGLDFLDELEDEDEAINDGEKTIGAEEEVLIPVVIRQALDDLRARATESDNEETIDDNEKVISADKKAWNLVNKLQFWESLRACGATYEPMTRFFTIYLLGLQPTTWGNVDCPVCMWSFTSEFDLDYAWDHFRSCWSTHAMGLKGSNYRESTHCLLSELPIVARCAPLLDRCERNLPAWEGLKKIEPPEIIDKLRTQCSDRREHRREQFRIAAQAQLPSPIVFLTQLRPFCDGQLTCIGPKCKGTRFFDASWDHLKSHYEGYHADYLLQDEDIRGVVNIDIHLARQKRDFKRLFAKAQICREEWASMDDDKRKTEYLHCTYSLECECSAHRRLPTMPQFNVLKDLNGAFRSRYQQFCQHAAKSDSKDMTAFMGELRLKCPRPRDLRRLGTRIFKQVIQGTSPTTLLEIFAFISLSQAMANVMSRRNIHIDLNPGTIDYLSWRTLIEDEASQRLYDEILIAWFHPRWKDELHYDRSHQTPLSVQEEMKRFVLQLMKAKQTNGAFKFSAFLRLNPFSQKQAPQESSFALLDGDCEPSDSPADTHPNKEENDDPGGSDTEALINTVIFVRVWLFMIFIAALGVALLYLSNPEQRCHIRSAADEEHVVSVYDIVLVIETLKNRILNHLRQDRETPIPDEIVTTAEEALDGGYIWSVTDFHIHLQKAVLNHVEEPGLRSLLGTEITTLCRDAFNSIQSIFPGWSPSIFPSHVGV
ncbi:uncharacterized protein NECHADRAFT_86783 [Fusarium vanettenii 77-13-4]|uniref:Uncharacterized protein n=1 Tax=Fusarium vanettenii (strain ATCC MYA-4622 / CBS 123669 / FGSC 9596 / NRRL 45880 / 77-13-4) TaxID=660122 RepID=C7ZK21_FUSV7|nr:uncharacterized protein NECHADRAFT_86783 [Fusarium vanettenii 77-13-4]EEU35561.1 predicted protein [Fusarium vanettenii 77-13-4]